MLRGLELLSDGEFTELGQLIGIDLKSTKNRSKRILSWMAKVVDSNQKDPSTVERAVLEWVAKRWMVQFPPTIDTNDLERLVRRKIATEATEFLAPAWRVVCALTVEDVSVVDKLKFEMLTKAAEEVVPSQSVLERYREEWTEACAKWSREDPRADLEGDLKTLAQHPGLGRQALKLGIVIALADGRLSADEERLIGHIAAAVGLPEKEAPDLTSRLNESFCEHRARLVKEKRLGPIHSSVEAAECTLVESGALAGLAKEARENIVQEEEADQAEATDDPPQGWEKLLGALSGITHFFSSKVDEEAPSNLVRIVYLTIQRQRAEVMKASAPSR